MKLPLCGSVWQPVHFSNESPTYFTYGLASGIETWHLAQAIVACAPVRGNFEAAWLNPEAGFHVIVVWQLAQLAPSWPWCSSVWQLTQSRERPR